MKAVILAGGEGRRLLPYTTILPKPLMPIGDKPILEILVDSLRDQNIKDLVFSVGYLGSLIQAYFGDGSKFGVNIKYSFENKPLGTAGPLTLIETIIEEPFLVMNGDIITDLKFSTFIDAHVKAKALSTIAVYNKEVNITLGVLDIENGCVVNYAEKPTIKYPVSTGIYCFNKVIFDYLSHNKKCDLPDLILSVLRDKQKVKAFMFSGLWFDIGRHEDYNEACHLLDKDK